MKKIFLVYALVKETKIRSPFGDQDLKLSWTDGMIGVCPVFENEEDALQYAGDKFEVMEMADLSEDVEVAKE